MALVFLVFMVTLQSGCFVFEFQLTDLLHANLRFSQWRRLQWYFLSN